MAFDSHTRPGGHLLSNIIAYCSENLPNTDEDDGLDGVLKNSYCSARRKSSQKDDISSSKLRCLVVPAKCRLVSFEEVLQETMLSDLQMGRYGQIRRTFFATTFEARRNMSFDVQEQLHIVPGKQKLYVIFTNVDVCEVAYYIIHAVSKFAYHSYKAAAKSGRVYGSHGNSRIHCPQITRFRRMRR